jgi:hypothetical protein
MQRPFPRLFHLVATRRRFAPRWPAVPERRTRTIRYAPINSRHSGRVKMGSGRNDSGWRDDRGMRASHDDHRSAPRGSRGNDRGFFERAGDEISSWFGDDEAERRREMDERSGYGRELARGD